MTKIYVSPSSQEANLGPNGYVEEVAMNLVADLLCPELTRHGVEWMRNNRLNTYAGHVKESNLYKPDSHVGIHSDATGTNVLAHGCTILCYKPDINKNSEGTLLAKAIYTHMAPLTPTEDRGVKDGSTSLSEIRDTDAPAVLIEVEFHDNPEGAMWIITHIPQIAGAILSGILDHYGIAYIPPIDAPVDYKSLYDKLLIDFAALSDVADKTCLQRDDLANKVSKLSTDLATLSDIADKTSIQRDDLSKKLTYFKDAAGVWHTDLQNIAETIIAAVIEI